MRKILCDGNVGSDAVFMKAKNGRDYLCFQMANTFFNHGLHEYSTGWLDVYSFDEEFNRRYINKIRKGSRVVVQGDLNIKIFVTNGEPSVKLKIKADKIDIQETTSNFANINAYE